MPRYKLTIEYDGAPFAGWQIQADGVTVQGVLTAAIEALSGEKDTGRRAPAAPMPACTRAGRWRMSISPRTGIPTPCATRSTRICARIRWRCCRPRRVAGDFNARTSAVKRHYLYRIVNRRADLTVDAGHAWRVPRPLDAAAMHAAAQRLIGKHDFTTFRSTECQAASPVKTLDRLDVERDGDELASTASARSFLHTQVRSMVGSLVMVGEGRWSAARSCRVLAARDRTACGPLAPPDGLYLMRVDY